MSTTLADLARLVGGESRGDDATPITGAATLSVAKSGDVTLADRKIHARELVASAASAAIVSQHIPDCALPTIVVDDVHAAFSKAVQLFRPLRNAARVGVSKSAIVSPNAKIAADVDIHPGATIEDDVVIGARSTIHSGVCIGAGCVIGSDATVFPNVVLYENTQLGDRVMVHAGAVIGAYGFGYRQAEGRHVLSAQLGNVEIGNDVEIGAGSTIDRGTYGPTVIGEGTKIDNLVMIAHNCRLGRHNLICSQVGVAGSTTTGDYVVMAGQVGVRDHVHIGEGAVLCSRSAVANDVADGIQMLGEPAKPLRQQKVQMAAVAKLPEMRRQFRAMQRQLEQMQTRLASAEGELPNEQAA